jgi:hypothetical protein
VTTTYAVVAAIVIAAVILATTTHLTRAHRKARRLPTITEQEAREHARPLSHAIIELAPINPPKTEEPPSQASRSTT